MLIIFRLIKYSNVTKAPVVMTLKTLTIEKILDQRQAQRLIFIPGLAMVVNVTTN